MASDAKRLAVLMCNTDVSEFSARHPRDGDKFRALIALARPDWAVDVFDATQGVFPDVAGFDGVIVTGSPASVHDPDPWVAQLLDVIRDTVAQGVPLFGACFGHQAVALALGGRVERSRAWVLGHWQTRVVARAPWMAGLPDVLVLAAAHNEQVTRLPDGAELLTTSDDCPNGGFRIGDRVWTTQYHPEITPEFIAALTDHLGGKLPADVIATARATLARTPDRAAMAGALARFFAG